MQFYSKQTKAVKEGTAGIGVAGAGVSELGATDEFMSVTKDYIAGIKEMWTAGTVFGKIMSVLGAILSPIVFLFDLLKASFIAFVNLMKWAWGIIKVFGDNMLKLGAWLLEGLLKAWDWIKGIGETIWTDYLKPAWEWFLGVGEKIWTDILKPAWEWFKGVGEKIWTKILKPSWDWFLGVGQKIWDNILKPAWEWFSDIGTKIWDIIKKPFQWLGDRISSLFGGKNKSGTKAFGGIIPQTGMYLMHQGEVVTPAGTNQSAMGNNINITVNVNGGSSDMDYNAMARKIAEEIRRRV